MAPESAAHDDRSWIRRNGHFLFAVVLIAMMWVATVAQGWVEKYPVPWPPRVQVSQDLRLTAGLPDRFGPYELVSAEQYKKIFGQPGEGERVFDQKLLAALGMTPSGYRDAHARRKSSWYASRIYIDTDTGPNATACPLWVVNVYYYSGLRDKVPHVPEICLVAGGAEITSPPGSQFLFDARNLNVQENWRKQLTFNKIEYVVGPPDEIRRPGVEYYIFSYNGQPMNDRLEVRLRLGNPLESHNYFAKVQFSPMGSLSDEKQTAAATRKFVTYMLPAVLETLPTADDIRTIEQSSGPDASRSRPAGSD